MRDPSIENAAKPPLWCSCRATLAVLCFLGFANMFALRFNLSVAMVCMVNQTAVRETQVTDYPLDNTSMKSPPEAMASDACRENKHGTTTFGAEDGELAWDKESQALIIGCLFWGYTVTQVPGGYLAARFGGKHVFGWFMLLCAVATLLMPVAARVNHIFLIVLRFVAGAGQGVVWPAAHAIWAYWSPPQERSRLLGFSFAGGQIGYALTLPISALLCEYGFDGGWPSVFYLTGGVGVLWSIAWLVITANTPEKHPRISQAERQYIQNSLKKAVQKEIDFNMKVPWGSIARSMPFLATVAMQLSSDWSTYTFLTSMPAYINEVFHFDIKINALLSAIPSLCWCIVAGLSGQLADRMLQRGISTTTVRKFITAIGGFGVAGMSFGLGFLDCTRPIWAIIVMTLAVAFHGCTDGGGVNVNVADIAPKYASLLYGMSNTFASLSGFFAPFAIGQMTTNQRQEEWKNVLFLSAAITLFGTFFFLIFASGELQEWAKENREVACSETVVTQTQTAHDDVNEHDFSNNLAIAEVTAKTASHTPHTARIKADRIEYEDTVSKL